MSVTYKEFTDGIRAMIWPHPGEQKELVEVHSKYFLEAFIQLQRWVPCLQANHTSVFPACSTYVQCGLTVVEAPAGVIKRVYTIANGEWCDLVYISARGHKEVLQWQRCLMLRFEQAPNLALPALQQGFRFHEASVDSASGRSRTGIWSINRKKFHLAPWIQSNESLVIEWDGEKTVWLLTDVLDANYWTPEVAAIVKLYVQKSHERDFGCDRQKKMDLERDFAKQLGDLVYACEQKIRNQENLDAEELNVRGPTQAEVTDDAVPTVSDQETIAYIADWANGDGTADVAALVESWGPDYIVTGGDNWYGADITKASLDEAVGPHYGDYIYPYLGTLADGAERTNNFYPAVGDHDRDPVGREAVFLNYFNRNKTYFDFIRGHIHWFIVDAGYNDANVLMLADGNTSSSVQGHAIKLKMALSTARWKIVVVAAPPYSSRQGNAAHLLPLRWPFELWGADLVLSGDDHLYERLEAPEGYPLIIAGWSGRSPLSASGVPNAYSQLQYDADYGALKLTVSCDELKAEAINRVGTVVDTLLLEKP